MAAIIDGAAALGLLMYGAQELPLGGTHLGARRGAAGRGVEEKPHDERVALGDEEAAELVKPECAVDTRRGLRELVCGFASDGLRAVGGMMVMEGCEVFLELERGVELVVILLANKCSHVNVDVNAPHSGVPGEGRPPYRQPLSLDVSSAESSRRGYLGPSGLSRGSPLRRQTGTWGQVVSQLGEEGWVAVASWGLEQPLCTLVTGMACQSCDKLAP